MKRPFNEVIFDAEARDKLRTGIQRLTDVVKITLGPHARTVMLEQDFGPPNVVDDGVTIAEAQQYKDEFEDMGAQLIKQVARETEDSAGDGTTTATVLANELIVSGIRHVVSGVNPMHLKKGLDTAATAVIAELDKMSRPLKGKKAMANVATISAHDNAIGQTIAAAMDLAGNNGVITVEEGESTSTTLETVEGMQFDREYVSPYFITDSEKMEAVLEDAYILTTDQDLKSAHDLLPLLEKVAQEDKSLLIIANDIAGKALTTLVFNRLRGTLQVCAVKAPGFGDRRKAMLEDIAVLIGGEVIGKDAGMRVEDTELCQLGQAQRIVVNNKTTMIIGGKGDEIAIRGRISQIKTQMENTTSNYDREKLEERAAKLAGGVVIVKIGGSTEAEMKTKKHQVEDALGATKAAVEEGILPGGGVALINASKVLNRLSFPHEEQRIGARLLERALTAPLKQLAVNAGLEGSVVVEKVKPLKPGMGLDVVSETYVNMVDAGIIDPAKVTKSAVRNATSIAGLILTTGGCVAPGHEQKN